MMHPTGLSHCKVPASPNKGRGRRRRMQMKGLMLRERHMKREGMMAMMALGMLMRRVTSMRSFRNDLLFSAYF